MERPLKPTRKTALDRRGSTLAVGQVKLVVNIQSAHYLSVRDASKPEDSESVVQVAPLFECSFQDCTMRTSQVTGQNPTWQQMITFEFRWGRSSGITPRAPNDDYSPDNLKSIGDALQLNLYDQVASALPKDDRQGEHTVHEQLERHWLGAINLPFATIYHSGKVRVHS